MIKSDFVRRSAKVEIPEYKWVSKKKWFCKTDDGKYVLYGNVYELVRKETGMPNCVAETISEVEYFQRKLCGEIDGCM